jgi:hypothetical protein
LFSHSLYEDEFCHFHIEILQIQVFNEICSRRIHDEYDFFSGLITNPIFMAVLIITVGLQAIIINFLGMFFKVSM